MSDFSNAVVLRCSKCGFHKIVLRQNSDPPKAFFVNIDCLICYEEEGFEEVLYFDSRNRQIFGT